MFANKQQDRATATPANPRSSRWHDGLTDEEARRRADFARRFQQAMGPRHARCTWENYTVTHPNQKAIIEALRRYGADFAERQRNGEGIVLTGTCGTGKDHLLAALGVQVALLEGAQVCWLNGLNLWSMLRDAISRDTGEREVLRPYVSAGVLVISDPLPPSGALTEFQAHKFLELVDDRYRHLRPTWVSMNVAGRKDAEERLGSAVVDRLRDGALCLECKWPSHRRAAGV